MELTAAGFFAVGVVMGFAEGWWIARMFLRYTTSYIRENRRMLRRGDRPDVKMNIGGVIYDVTETGVKSETPSLTTWTYQWPIAIRDAVDPVEIEVAEIPPFTEIEMAMPPST